MVTSLRKQSKSSYMNMKKTCKEANSTEFWKTVNIKDISRGTETDIVLLENATGINERRQVCNALCKQSR